MIGPQLPGYDGRTRKSYNSSYDEPSFPLDGFIEEDLRAGGPCLCPLPLQNLSVPKSSPLVKHIAHAFVLTRFHVRDILRSHRIKFTRFSYSLNASTRGEKTYSIPTLNIEAFRHSPDEPWLEITREIYAFLASRGFPDMAVDMRRPSLDKLYFAVPLKSDLADPIWSSLFYELSGTPDEQEVLSYEVCRLGYDPLPKDNPLTLVVKVCEETQRDWRLYRNEMVYLLDRIGLSHLAVSIVKTCGVDDPCGNCGCMKANGTLKYLEEGLQGLQI